MKNKKILISSMLALSLIIGVLAGTAFKNINQAKSEHEGHSLSINPTTNSIEEEFWNVDLVIKGTVSEQQESNRDSGITGKANFSYDVTSSTIQVNEILYGDLATNQIVLLQHGNKENEGLSSKHLKKDEEVILFLVKTTDGYYWSYNFDDGIWKIKNGKVNATPLSERLEKYVGTDEKTFINDMKKAVKNKKRNKEFVDVGE
ncbi:hypothetical protein [Paenibacillus harenae]|uniref:Uncharacterized protein n=1 Tax=Paenibacillus harenae TaxID=306543 RepID=A0ABT9U3X1_PAEHA|nr:hypothetical protein [Paenibacillus harenae]MDQ0114335.1 hypothetical protein [Paenibacillus harenae]